MFEIDSIRKASSKTLVIHPNIISLKKSDQRTPQTRLEEACGLAMAIKLEIIDKVIVNLKTIRPSTFIGVGKVKELGPFIAYNKIALVVMDCNLSPIQQRNLEKAWDCKVIDRTALILEIFGERAKTREGSLQVELAALEYQKSRLVRSWTHLERQRGGFGFMGGPGERQIESDRRQINERITRIKKELESVKRTRSLHRKSRQKVPYPVVALVGYTNAGKSTLFNRLTSSKVRAEDLLFATLDPTMRMIALPSKRKIILSDTVGFISDLPTELVAAFRATLEEVIEADLILHIRDISSPDTQSQKHDVLKILHDLGLQEKMAAGRIIEVLNKIDLVNKEATEKIKRKDIIAVSALTGKGCDELLKKTDEHFSSSQQVFEIDIKAGDGHLLAWLYNHGENVKTSARGELIHVWAELSEKNQARFEKMTEIR